jgi:hypothetical protein
MRNKTVLGVTLSRLVGLMIFLLILGILNLIEFDSIINMHIIEFFNQNIGIIILFSILLYIGELFSIFIFPLNTPAPFFNAIGGIFLAEFIFKIFYMLGDVLNQNAFFTFKLLEPLAYILIFFLVIIFGYIKIFIDLIPKRKEKKTKTKNIRWKDIGNEFRMAAYNLASTIKESLKPKKKR